MTFDSILLMALLGLCVILTIGSSVALKDKRAAMATPAPLPSFFSRWKMAAAFLFVFISVAIFASFLDHLLLRQVGWSRDTVFFSSFSVFVVVLLVGAVYEDRLLWNGHFNSYLTEAGERRTDFRLMSAPITLGLCVGLLSFLAHDTARPYG